MGTARLMVRVWAVLAAGLLAASGASAETLRLECAADTSICIHPSEQTHNHGGKSRLRVKGNEHILLAKFNMASLGGRRAKSARLYFHPAGEVRLKTMGLSTVVADWVEGTSSGPAKRGEVTFLMAAHGERTWQGPGSTFLEAAFEISDALPWHDEAEVVQIGSYGGHPNSRVWYADVRQEAGGWLSLPLAASAVDALTTGSSFGLALADEKGQTRWNNDVFSREQSGKGPYLLVEPLAETLARPRGPEVIGIGGGDGKAPKRNLLVASPRKAPAAVGWQEAGGLRYRVAPLWAQVNPAGGTPHFDSGQSGWIFDGTTVRLRAARNWFACVQVIVEPGDGKGLQHTVEMGELRDDAGRKLAGWSRAMPVWFIRGEDKPGSKRWLPDPLLPQSAAGADVGAPAGGVRVTLLEVYVDHDAAPGTYRGNVEIRRPAAAPIRIPLELTVHKATLPDELAFKVSLNTYGSPGGKHGRKYPSKEFAAEELAWHRMAHEHRSTIAVVPYSQSGRVEAGMAPEVAVDASGGVKVDWSAWDRRWAPYFTGEAFKGLARDGVPLNHFYLPLHENWPLEIEKHYKWAGDWETHWRRAGPIEEGLTERYQRAFSAVAGHVTLHIARQGWRRTQFQCYLNNKYDYKRKGRGSSYWLLDEPMHRDDFLALRFFAQRFIRGARRGLLVARMEGIEDPPVGLVARVDLSRPQWARDYLWGVAGLRVCNAWRDWPVETFVHDCRPVWSYGTTPGPDAPLTDVWRWLLEAWAAGCDGMVPWQTIGRQDSWTVPEATSVIYPSRPGMAEGPVASLRLKALRAAEQDIELWRLLARKERWKVGNRVARRDRLAATTGRGSIYGRGISGGVPISADLGGVTADEIVDLRRRVLKALDE